MPARDAKKTEKITQPTHASWAIVTQAGKQPTQARYNTTKQHPINSVGLIKKVHPSPVSQNR
jgi:hypothetical protein